jgi:hypothetical protein
MKTRPLHLLVPILVLAVGYFAWDAGFLKGSAPRPEATVSNPGSAILPSNPNFAPPPAEAEKPTVVFDTSREGGCEIVTRHMPNGDGTALELYSCEPLKPKEKHPYESYSSAALESLAYSDAKAAEILGVRLRDKDLAKSMSLMIRASALQGGDTGPVLHFFHIYPHPHAIDGVPVKKAIRAKFVLSAVADLLSGDTYYTGLWEDRIRQYSSNPETEIALLHEQALQIVGEMRQIELEVTGSSEIGGRDDA